MNTQDLKCAAEDGLCTQALLMDAPVPLCLEHAIEVSRNVTDTLYAAALPLDEPITDPMQLITSARQVDAQIWDRRSHEPCVYFIANGDRIKIGTTTNIRARTGSLALRREHIQLLLEGGTELERALHAHFGGDRIGNTEWFAYSPSIRAMLRERRGSATIPAPSAAPAIEVTLVPTATPKVDRRHPRRDEVTEWVREAGEEGITVADIRDRLVAQYPSEQPPSDTSIQNWFSAHPSIEKPGRGRYFWDATGQE